MIAALVLAAAVAIPPVPTDYVTDNAHALSAGTASAIRQELQTYHDTTGNRVLVYVDQTTGDTPLEDWTIRAAEKWKIGSKDKDNGAILFAFMQDRKIRIEVGYGLESALTDADASRIIQETMIPKMRSGDVDGAIQSGVDRMLVTITPSFRDKIGHQVAQEPAYTQQMNMPTALALLIIFLIFGAVFILLVVSVFNRRSWWYAGTGAGGWSGGGWSSGGGGFSGGGFSGGGGFGGGGASGGW